MDRRERRGHNRCSFCGKAEEHVKRLIAGPGVFICDGCVALCHQVLADRPPPAPPSPALHRSWVARTVGRLWKPRRSFYEPTRRKSVAIPKT
jgi:hypothetical protein